MEMLVLELLPAYFVTFACLTLILLTWRMWWANNASRWKVGFNSVFKGLIVIPVTPLITAEPCELF